MKKAIAYLLAILFITSMFFVGCKAKQQPKDTYKEVFVKKDSSSHLQIIDNNKAILDSLRWYIGTIKTAKPECDSVTQAAIENILRNINSQKISGDNSYQLKYNQLLKRLDLVIKIGATKNKITKDFQIKETFYDRFITKTITVERRLPKWQLYLMLIGSGAIIFVLFKLLLLLRKFLPA